MNFDEEPMHVVTPLRHSPALSALVPDSPGVYLKIENYQTPGSFKIRGFGRQAQKFKREGYNHLVTATTGNTGFATAHAARLLGMKCTLFLPESTPAECADKLRKTGFEVTVIGAHFNNCLQYAIEASKEPGAVLTDISDPEVQAGYSTIVDELVTQLPSKPGVIAVSVGDGGMILGIIQGLKRAGWEDVPLLGIETKGADSFNLSIKANKIVALDEITSIAISLGTRTINPDLLDLTSELNIISEVVTDAEVVESCIRYIDDEFAMVEPSCGATLTAVYSGILTRLYAEGHLPQLTSGPAVLVVCGGRVVSLNLLQKWAKQFNVPFPYHPPEEK